MIEFREIFPDADVLLALEPEELGAKLLFLLRRRFANAETFIPHVLKGEIWGHQGQPPLYARHLQHQINLALTEAWAWLEAQGLVVPDEGVNGQNGWRRLSRRARRFENEGEFTKYAIARMLPKEVLHPKLSAGVWLAFMRGEFDVAVLQAMKAVEVAVRDTAGLPAKDVGVPLMRKAFNRENGPLTDMTAENGERQALSDLFAGGIGSYKNPHSHRDVQLTDPAEAIEIIILANHLLRIVDSRREARP